jgi:hypothetical protein
MKEFLLTHPCGAIAILMQIPIAFCMWSILFNSARREEAFKDAWAIRAAMDGATFDIPADRVFEDLDFHSREELAVPAHGPSQGQARVNLKGKAGA